MTELIEEPAVDTAADMSVTESVPEQHKLSLAERARKITAMAAMLGAIAVGVTGAEGKSKPQGFNRADVWAQYQAETAKELGHGLIQVKVDSSEEPRGDVSVSSEFLAEHDELPQNIKMIAQKEIDTVNQLIAPNKRASKAAVKKLSVMNYPHSLVNGHGGSVAGHNIELEIKADSKIPAEQISATAFHEMIHYFQASQLHDASGYGDEVYGPLYEDFKTLSLDDYKAKEILNKVLMEQHASFDQRMVIEILGDNDESEGALFTLVDESSYEEHGGGHPYDATSEFMASLASVMRFYPDSLMENISKLDDRNQAAMVKTCHDLVEVMRKGAYNPEAVDSLFSPELMAFIGGQE